MNAECRQRLYDHLQSFCTLSNPRAMRAAWIITEDCKIYVRRGMHAVNGTAFTTLDLANVEVVEKRQGTWTFILETAQKVCPWSAVYLENVHSTIIQDHLGRLSQKDHRWVKVNDSFIWIRDWVEL